MRGNCPNMTMSPISSETNYGGGQSHNTNEDNTSPNNSDNIIVNSTKSQNLYLAYIIKSLSIIGLKV